MRELPLSDQHEVFAFGERLLQDGVDIFVLLTGVGTRLMVDALSTRHEREAVLAALGRSRLVCRGPKPVAVLKSFGLRPTLVAPEPNTWQDLLAALDAELPVAEREVVVQEYGRTNQLLLDGLRARGAKLSSVAVYSWAMPADTAPLAAGIETLCAGLADVVLFTSAQQVVHLFELAKQLGREVPLLHALQRQVLCASVGPVTRRCRPVASRSISCPLIPRWATSSARSRSPDGSCWRRSARVAKARLTGRIAKGAALHPSCAPRAHQRSDRWRVNRDAACRPA
jgi:uroporphyrinogen-III synthase